MKSIKKLEELISEYESDWGISDGLGNEYKQYKKDSVISRIDTATWFFVKNPKQIYKKELIRIAKELELISDNN